MTKRTYNEIGPNASYTYDSTYLDKESIMIISDNMETLDVVNGNNNIYNMITHIENIGSNVTELDPYCFANCQKLQQIFLPPTIEVIGDYAFSNCSNLSAFKDNVFNICETIGKNAFQNCNFEKIYIKTFYDDLKPTIDNEVFLNNYNLTDISMDNIVLGERMFENCISLSSVSFFPDSQSVYTGAEVFKNCKKLSTLTLYNITTYTDLNSKFLKGSNILSLFLPSMTYDEVEIAIKQGKNIIQEKHNENVELGEVYFFEGVSKPLHYEEIKNGNLKYADEQDKYDAYKNVLNRVTYHFIDAAKKHIPILIIRCVRGCTICDSIKKNVLKDVEFRNWLKKRIWKMFNFLSKFLDENK